MERIRSLKDIGHYLDQLVQLDARLVPIAKMAGQLPLRLAPPDFAGLAQVVVSQHVSKRSAAALMERLAKTVDPLTAENILKTDDELLMAAGLTRAKRQTLQEIASAIVDSDLDLSTICRLPADEAITQLTAFKGVGTWTAEVYLLFCGGHIDVFPAGDVALRTAIGDVLKIQPRPLEKESRRVAEQWAPFRGVAARLFWAYYAVRK